MSKIRMFFCATSKDLSMETMSLQDIVKNMQKTDKQSPKLPTCFAHRVAMIIEEEEQCEANKSVKPTA